MNILFKNREIPITTGFKMLFGKKKDEVKELPEPFPEIEPLKTNAKKIQEESKQIRFSLEQTRIFNSKDAFARLIENLDYHTTYTVEGYKYVISKKPNLPKGSYLPFFMLLNKNYIIRAWQ